MKYTSQLISYIAVITFIIILLTGCEKQITRKADWETNFNDIHFVDAKHGWIVGEKGMIIHTNDGGKTWERQGTGTEGDIKSVYFTNLLNGWAVGDKGLIVATDDGGKHWYLQESGIYSMLNGVFFSNSKEGWVVGEDADILYTQNGGKTWKRQSVSEFPFPFNDVWFMDNRHGWAVGERGLIVHTTDGGQSWKPQTSGSAFPLNSVHFVTPKKGWVVGELGTVLHTDDGGQSWVPQTQEEWQMLKGVLFLPNFSFKKKSSIIRNTYEGWVVGWPGFVMHTTNGGLTWTKQDTKTYNELYAVHFIDNQVGWVVGQFGEVLHTKDGGATWKFQYSGTQANLNKVYFADANIGIITGDNGVILMTANGGQKWHLQDSGTNNDLYGFALSPMGLVAVGKNGIATRYSIDTEKIPVELPPVQLPPVAEETKEPQVITESPTVEQVSYQWEIIRQATWRTDFADVCFLDEQTGWAVGSGGVIAHTTDGGKTWRPQHSGVKDDLRLVTFVDATHGWIAGSGMLLRTENGGETWQVIRDFLQVGAIDYDQDSPTFHLVKSQLTVQTMQFLNPKEGWLGVDEGQFCHTTDGGLTWKIHQTATTYSPITALHFLNSKEGWAVAPDRSGSDRPGGLILHTVDGGVYWQIQYKTKQLGIAVHFTDAKSGWVVMEDGNSLVTNDGGVEWIVKSSNLVDDTQLKISPHYGRILKIKFRNNKEAWGIGNDGSILITRDQGENWTRIDVLETEGQRKQSFRTPITNVHFVDDQHAWAVGKSGQIYHTADGGKTWERQLGEQLDDLRDALFFSATHGVIAGNNGLLLETQDGGQTWTQLQSGTRQALIGIHFSSNIIFSNIIESQNNVIASKAKQSQRNEGGAKQKTESSQLKWGWTMGRDGTVFYTTDGYKWSAGKKPIRIIEPEIPFAMNDVAFGDFSEGWAVGNDGQIIHNRDGGPIWTSQPTSTQRELFGLEMRHAPVGWAVGRSGVILRTINGGEYWKLHETNIGYDLHAVSFSPTNDRKGWVAGRYGIILSTTDGGFTWKAELSGVTKDLYGLLALSDNEIYAVGAEGTIIYSVDGGVTWTQQHTDIDNDLYAITLTKDGDTLWVVGQWGVVLRKKNIAL
jgi:photosystem II stability/assembly factor-like uncharacterized protein